MASKNILALLLVTVLCSVLVMEAEADVSIGSCVWGGVNYVSNCLNECKRRRYKGGHCGSFANNICWCET